MKTFLFVLFFGTQLFAAQRAVVTTEGAIIYKGPSFDAPILGYFSSGKKVSVSDKVYGAFYRVRFKQGVIGYISDIDVRTEKSKNNPETYFGNEDRKPPGEGPRPFFGSTSIGLQLAMIDYQDTVGGVTGNSQTSFLGGTLTTPLSFFDGAFLLSLNALYSLQVPEFYTKVSKVEPTGFVIIGDTQLLYPFYSALARKFTAYVGAGIGITYTNVELVQALGTPPSDKLVPTSSAKVGGVISGGFVYQFSKLSFRFEPKYYYEENAYLGITASLAFQF